MRALAAVLSIIFLLTGSAVAAAQPAWTSITWGPCPDNPPDSDCGTLAVPLDWNKPWGPTTTLAVARHKATDPAHRKGVLMVNPGGPGSSNAEFALFTGYFSPQVEADFDIVGVDERGTQGSSIIRCDFPTPEPSDDPTTPAEFEALRAYNQQVISQCRKDNSPIFDYANTAIGARDMDAVRRALGEQKISYNGISYGTLLGQQYAEMYGDHVRAMVLDSNMDHSVSLEKFITDRADTAEDVFTQFVKWCDTNETCVLHGQDVVAVWQQALQAAGQLDFRGIVFNTLYGPNFAAVAQMIADQAAGGHRVTPQFEYNYPSIRLATVCQDFSLRIKDFAQYSRLRAEELRHAPIMQGSPIGHDEATACIGIPGPPANPPHRLDLSHAPTILLMNSRHDPATSYAWALDIHRQAPGNTVLLTYEGTGHDVYTRSSCTRAVEDAYLLTLKAETGSCPEV
ncbi:alpha/beta hydrolase [Kutzneria sp. CA-103260]|uniref:alpha/beta hydrolase n=1 Tax=Kutzneria sp. CA-103260 TaxID=2802641 RepID=UPI001BAB4F82|nr:alpha/beta hydrolase [Kutzneria sp. CA-103260]QUQ65782.1 hydrolase [Kutzneria sp. CA-103260]